MVSARRVRTQSISTSLSVLTFLGSLGAALMGCPSADPPTRGDAGGGDEPSRDATASTGDARVPDGGVADANTETGRDANEIDAATADASSSDGPVTGLLRERSSYTNVEFRPDHPVATAFIAGPFNRWSPTATPLLDTDGDGTYTAKLALEPGLHPYKFVVDGVWMLDPGHQYRAYDQGIENSGLRAPDSRQPLLTLVDKALALDGAGRSRATLRLEYTEGYGGVGPDPGSFEVEHRHNSAAPQALRKEAWTWDEATWTLTLDLAGLEDGKHTLTVRASSSTGRAAEPLVLPFWVEPERFEWRDALIYMIVIDRFRNGDPGNDDPAISSAAANAQYEGGDLEGITRAIEDGYFDRLGVNALWLTPFNVGPKGAFPDGGGDHQVSGYHGYWPTEARKVDPRIGGNEALFELVERAHQHGIRILMDFVINHVHIDHAYVTEHPDWFGMSPERCIFATPGCDWTEHRLDGLFKAYMPDVKWENPETSEQFIADALWWLETFDLDGARVDAVKHVPDSAVFNLGAQVAERLETTGLDVFLTGETAMGWSECDPANPSCNANDYGTIRRYLGPKALDGQFDFVLHHAVAFKVFVEESKSMIHADVWTRASLDRFRGYTMTPFISSHDTPRFISAMTHPELTGNQWPEQPRASAPGPDQSSAYDRLGLAETWNLTIPGAPMLYYGDEYGEYGSRDPDNRHMMRFAEARSEREGQLFDRISAVGRARKEVRALRRGELVTLKSSRDFWAYARYGTLPNDFAIVLLNRGRQPAVESLTLPASVASLLTGQSLVDRIRGGAVALGDGATLNVTVPPLSAQILAP